MPLPGKHSVKEHYLLSYRKAMAAVVQAQFSASKASAGGRAGALALADNEHILQSLCCEGVDLRAYEKSSPSDRDSGLVSNDSSSEASSESGWMPDWTRSALDEVFGPLAETATMLYMSRGKSDKGGADIVGS
ncbi:g10850 [Coccomyxa viridis]|uniref:G10850 protein n=1 Tax=Coccomyxa viridis TaxID=1274662 RepID=A0ABP1G926_9CHLO